MQISALIVGLFALSISAAAIPHSGVTTAYVSQLATRGNALDVLNAAAADNNKKISDEKISDEKLKTSLKLFPVAYAYLWLKNHPQPPAPAPPAPAPAAPAPDPKKIQDIGSCEDVTGTLLVGHDRTKCSSKHF